MIVRVKLFARARDLAKSDVCQVEVIEQITVSQLRQRLREDVPALAGLLDRCVVAIDGEYAQDDELIQESSEIALIPPVSGGYDTGEEARDDLPDPGAD